MTFNIKSASEITNDKSTYLLYAPPGTGKTHTINYLEGKTLYISVDKSERPLKGNENIDILDFNTHKAWTEWSELVKWLAKSDLEKYDNIVIDNISELFRSMLGNLGRDGKNNRVPEMRHYQQVDFFIIDSFRFLQSLNKRLVFLAWEDTSDYHSEGGQVFTRTYPDIRDKVRNNIAGLCQVVAKLVINEKTGNRGFILKPTETMFAKNQISDDSHCKQDEIFKL
jgi:phage nucleotide-binding protein